MLFKGERFNPNKRNTLVKTIRYELKYVICSQPDLPGTNIGHRVKSHFRFSPSLVFGPTRRTINYKGGGLCQQRTENEACISLHLRADH